MASPKIGGGDIKIEFHFNAGDEEERETILLVPTPKAGFGLCDDRDGLATVFQAVNRLDLNTMAKVVSLGANIDLDRAKYLVFFGGANFVAEHCKLYLATLIAGGRIEETQPPKKKLDPDQV